MERAFLFLFTFSALTFFGITEEKGNRSASLLNLGKQPSSSHKDNTFKARLKTAQNGDFIVVEASKMITLLSLRSLTLKTVVLEEISVPRHNLPKIPSSWHNWVKEHAPGHTSWSMLEIDLDTGQILECYSFSRAAWIEASQEKSLFATLLLLPLKEVSVEERKKIGSPPLEGEPDRRQIWQPPLIFEGKKIEKAKFDAFEAAWPKDHSELSGKTVSLYFDRTIGFPLPFWVQVDASYASATFQVVDSGKNLPSIYRSIPRRVPEFVGLPQKTKEGLKLSVKSPKYYYSFELFAIDVTNKEKKILPVSHSLKEGQGEFLTIEVDEVQLQEALEIGHKYTFLLVPSGHAESYTETIKPFTWN